MKRHHSSSDNKSGKGGKAPAAPYVGKPLDGSQYRDVIEEQIYSEQRPRPEEEQPRRSRNSQDRAP